MEYWFTYLIEYFEMQPENLSSYYDRQTGGIFTVSKDERVASEFQNDKSSDDIFNTQKAPVQRGSAANKRDLTSERYVPFPDKYDFDESRKIELFIDSIGDEYIKQELMDVLRGSVIAEKFRYAIIQYDLDYKWYEYRKKAITEFIKNWCELNQIEIPHGTEELN